MNLRRAVITGDELFSDAYDIVDGTDDSCVEVNCDLIVIKEGAVDIGQLESALALWLPGPGR